MAKLSTSARYLLSMAAAVAATSLISGCSGSSAVTPTAAAQLNAAPGHVLPLACKHHGAVNVDVDPCAVDLTTSNPSATVTVNTRESKKGTFSESDNCGGPSGIATVAQGSGDQWTVSAGATTGSCTATFSFKDKRGKTVGTADLSIANGV